MKILFLWVQVVQDLIVIKAPAWPVHVHSVRKDNTKGEEGKTVTTTFKLNKFMYSVVLVRKSLFRLNKCTLFYINYMPIQDTHIN